MSRLTVSFENFRGFWCETSGGITLRRDTSPIGSVAQLNAFVATRSAFIAQKTLYGYVKTRMGTRYPLMFDDDVFVQSIDIAKMHVFAACLSDLTIHAVARATHGLSIPDDRRAGLALVCYRPALAKNGESAPEKFPLQPCIIDGFSTRLGATDWAFGALRRENFSRSPRALVRWAPIAPELKRFDEEIVANSIRFAWRDVRSDFDRRLDPASIGAELADESPA